MINARINNDRTVPWWAVILAPVVGVPAMVALLAISTPDRAPLPSDPGAGVAIERVEPTAVEYSVDRGAEHVERSLPRC